MCIYKVLEEKISTSQENMSTSQETMSTSQTLSKIKFLKLFNCLGLKWQIVRIRTSQVNAIVIMNVCSKHAI